MPNMLTEVNGQTSLQTLVKVKAEALVVENEKALAKKVTHTITYAKNDTLFYTLLKVEAEVLVVTQVDMLAEVKVQLFARLYPR